EQVEYPFWLKSHQQWGYALRYAGSTLVLSLRHQPHPSSQQSLQGVTIIVDPGHGGPEDLGARGPTGYPEKDVTLIISRLLARELRKRGARVVLTRTADVDVSLADRVALINRIQPTLALSLHYNALPDNGDALNTQGISTFWYHPQSHSLAVFLHNFLTQRLSRPSAGVFWNNLALTRPAITPSVLLELGFMIHPDEFEWIIHSTEQHKLAVAIADGVMAWITKH
ncbi:MAG: N-acetylmuramoyl-L-alanine amidase, partial [Synechococcales cyanobacterium]